MRSPYYNPRRQDVEGVERVTFYNVAAQYVTPVNDVPRAYIHFTNDEHFGMVYPPRLKYHRGHGEDNETSSSPPPLP